MNNDIWTREHPEPPPKGLDSLWYWFYKDGETQPRVAEVWPERTWWSPGWWGPPVSKPKTKPRGIYDEQKVPKNSKSKDEEQNQSIHDATHDESDESKTKPKSRRRKKSS